MRKLERICSEQIDHRYSESDSGWAFQRLERELVDIYEYRHDRYFGEAVAIAKRIRDRGDSCRLIGSACASLVAYLTGLSDVDPIEHDLPYERFLVPRKGHATFTFITTPPIDESATADKATSISSRWGALIHAARGIDALPILVASRVGHPPLGRGLIAGKRDDPAAFALLGSGDVEGIAPHGWPSLVQLLQARKPQSLVEIAAIQAVDIEEVNNRGLSERFARENDDQHGHSSHPLVAKTLRATHGFILFQEQIMLLLNRLADIPPADGLAFIKAVKWGENDDLFYRTQSDFMDGAVASGLTGADAEALFDRIYDAAKVVLCKSHHMAQAVLTYEAAYLKAHHPNEFHEALQQVSQGATADH